MTRKLILVRSLGNLVGLILTYILTCYKNEINFLRSSLKALGGFLKDPFSLLVIVFIIKLPGVVPADEALLNAASRFLLITVLSDAVKPLLPSFASGDVGLYYYAFRVLLVILYVPILARSGS